MHGQPSMKIKQFNRENAQKFETGKHIKVLCVVTLYLTTKNKIFQFIRSGSLFEFQNTFFIGLSCLRGYPCLETQMYKSRYRYICNNLYPNFTFIEVM
jgi:hypothetical protein